MANRIVPPGPGKTSWMTLPSLSVSRSVTDCGCDMIRGLKRWVRRIGAPRIRLSLSLRGDGAPDGVTFEARVGDPSRLCRRLS